MTVADGDAAAPGSSRSSYKPIEVEELIDVAFHRPLARGLVQLLLRTSISSNAVTLWSGLLGIVAGLCVGFADPADPWLVAVGGLVLLVSVIFDCADGQLARLRGTASLAGRALDGWIDALPITGMFVGTCAFLLSADYAPWLCWGLGAGAGMSLRWHADRYDHAKCLYLANTQADRQVENLPTWEEIDAEEARLKAEGDWFMALFMRMFRTYTKMQRRGKTDVAGLDRPGMQTAEQRVVYRRLFRGQMRGWSWIGIGTHHFFLFVTALLVPIVGPDILVAVWLVIFVPANIVTFALAVRHRRLEEQLLETLHAGSGSDGGAAGA